MKLHHIGIAVNDISITWNILKALFDIKENPEPFLDQKQKVNEVHFRLGDILIQLVEPTSENSPISNFLKARGGGLHHLCFEVDDIEAVINHYKKNNIRILYEPFQGAFGHRYAFISPDDTARVLIEFVEKRRKI